MSNKERMLVAFGGGRTVLLAYSGEVLDNLVSEMGRGDVLCELGEDEGVEEGLSVWEGVPYCHTSTNCYGEHDVEGPYFDKGTWRAPTLGELALLVTDCPVWPTAGQ